MGSVTVAATALAVSTAGAVAMVDTEAVSNAANDGPSVAGVFGLAVLQGLTEFLPISSSGHLAVGKELMDVHEGGLALDVALHVGTLFAIIAAFRKDVLRLFTDLARGQFGMWIWLIVATLPVAIIGLSFKDQIEVASGTFIAVAPGFFLTAIWLLVGERARRRNERNGAASAPGPASGPTSGPARSTDAALPADTPRLLDAVVMGFAQAVAIWPGVSRSGSTISAGLLRGLRAEEAARLSFLMSLPAISGAAIVEIPDALEEGFGGLDVGTVVLAAAVAGLVGFAALKTLLLVLRKGSFPWFAGYCAALGAFVIVLHQLK